MPLSASQRSAQEQVRKDWRAAPQLLNTPFTAGSHLVFPIAPFGPAHYAQEDTSLNQALWSLWPVSESDEPFEEVLQRNEAKRDEFLTSGSKGGNLDGEKLKVALPHAERARIVSMIRLIQQIHWMLNAVGRLEYDTLADGQSPLHLLDSRKLLFDVRPLDKAVEAAKRIKKEGDVLVAKARRLQNTNATTFDQLASAIFSPRVNAVAGAAVGKYCSALLALWPWTASGLIMTPEVAFGSGIAEIENELWHCIASACLRQYHFRPGPDAPNGSLTFIVFGRLANLVPVHTRYVPFHILHRALDFASANGLVFSQMAPELFTHEMREGAMLGGQCAVGAAHAPDAWAHADCDTKHKGCIGIGFSSLEKASVEGKLTQANQEREAEAERLLQERILTNPGYMEKSEDKGNEAWNFDKEGKKIDGPLEKRDAVYMPDGSVEFLKSN